MSRCQSFDCKFDAIADLVLFHKSQKFMIRIQLCEKHDRITFSDKHFEITKEYNAV